MEKHKCKLCSRRFTSGRALGGHMRSHFTILPVPDKAQPSQLSETSSSSSDLKQLEKTSLIKLEGSIVLDGESETESRSFVKSPRSVKGKKQCRNEFRKLGKKKSKMSSTESGTELELMSSVASETTSEEDLAMCLMLLSQDKWVRTEQNFQEKRSCATRDKFQLGHEKNHECQVCYKVFRSGQALGGHKRSHLSSSAASAANSSASANASLIDLNLPAPLDDVEAVSHSQIQVFC